MKDYLNHPDLIPANVQEILNREYWEQSYEDCELIKILLNRIGWTVEYDLNAELYELRPIQAFKQQYG